MKHIFPFKLPHTYTHIPNELGVSLNNKMFPFMHNSHKLFISMLYFFFFLFSVQMHHRTHNRKLHITIKEERNSNNNNNQNICWFCEINKYFVELTLNGNLHCTKLHQITKLQSVDREYFLKQSAKLCPYNCAKLCCKEKPKKKL